eukprot:TRINITY_DN16974_c0_g1_i1.p1 TRINITY_DN16974_c0_g1~~TRINITY_DN16974_c0_g1_i1.p1  ORF type:complete len:180 (-),score=39.34 TRINITY_DN16974_c0_g1_i1:37-543(-)
MCIRDRYQRRVHGEVENDSDTLHEGQTTGDQKRVDDYASLLHEKDLESDSFQNFVMKIFSSFDILDSFGLTLNDIFMHQNAQKEYYLKIFVIGLEIWGSHLPLKINLKKKSLECDFHQRLAIIKLRAMIKKLEEIAKQQSKIKHENKVVRHILTDFCLLYTSPSPRDS